MKDAFSSVNMFIRRYSRNYHYYTDPNLGASHHFLSHIEEGNCRFTSEQSVLEVKAGDFVYIPKGLIYHSHWTSRGQIRFKSFSFLYLPESDTRQYLLQKIDNADALKALMNEFPPDQRPSSYYLGRFYSAVAEILPYAKYEAPNKKNQLIKKAQKYIMDNETCSVSDIAKHCLISESALYDIFRKETGTTPNEFRQQVLCEKAEQLLSSTDLSVQEISNKLHFSSTSYFRKVLRKHTGKTPRQIRQSVKLI